MNRWLPTAAFVAFFAAILGATLYFAPSWGLMDDSQFLSLVRRCWENPRHWWIVVDTFKGNGMFRPFFVSWSVLFYTIFQHWPTGFYIFVAAWNMAAMYFWGKVFFRLFAVRREDYFWTVFFFPLTFFIFTPYWNIYNYISLQEKFILFFAPLSLLLFQRSYRDFRPRAPVILFLLILVGLFSKATFLFIPAAFAAYALLDLIFFHYRPKVSWIYLIMNALIVGAYAVFTFTIQMQETYTHRYKENVGIMPMIHRLFEMSLVMKVMLLIGLIGLLIVIVRSFKQKNKEGSLAALVYLGLMAYVVLLMPWGSQSYLLSATAPLVMGALFPVYAWLNGKGGVVKIAVNVIITGLLVAVFVGNIIPNISRMSDIAKAVAFTKNHGQATDQYFMPPPYEESAYAFGYQSGKTVTFCKDNVLNGEELSKDAANYVLLSELLPTVEMSGVRLGREVYANKTWRIFEALPEPGHHETFTQEFPKNPVQQLKIKIRNLY